MILVREKPSLRLTTRVIAPDGTRWRWAPDAWDAEDVQTNLSFSSTMPGGDEDCSSALVRRARQAFRDAKETARIQVQGPGGDVRWGGRIESLPQDSGSNLGVTPGAVGWQSHLDDNTSVRMIPVDMDESRWLAGTPQRKINLLAGGIDSDDASTAPDPDPSTGVSALSTEFSGPWGRTHQSEAWYDASGIPIAQVYYAWKQNGNIPSPYTNWSATVGLNPDPQSNPSLATANLVGAGPGSGLLSAGAFGSGGPYPFATVHLLYSGAGGASGQNYAIFWTMLAVYGDHGLPLYGTPDDISAYCVLASDVIAYGLNRWCPLIGFDSSTLLPSSFLIPHLPFYDPTTMSDVIKQSTRFESLDWAVWDTRDGPMYYQNPRGAVGRKWRARASDCQLQSTGLTMDRLYNGAVIVFTDPAGVTRSAGPPGSGCQFEDPALLDPDPLNPLNQEGVPRYTPPLQMGTGTSDGAIALGSRALQDLKALSTAGQATHVGWVEDEFGVLHPASSMRAGDQVRYIDASDTSYRRLVRAAYDDTAKANAISLDAPPQGIQQVLERFGLFMTGV